MGILPDNLLVDRAAGGCLPAFVLGWDAVPPKDAPPFVMEVGHQFGGYACHQVILSGLVFPLHANVERARRDPSLLLDGFRCIAESQQGLVPARPPRSRCPLVDAWGYTHGSPMSGPDLKEWDSLLGDYYELPSLEQGVEGMLTFSLDPSPSLVGWRALESVDDTGGSATMTVGKQTIEDLARSRPSDRASTPARLYLLWENSD